MADQMNTKNADHDVRVVDSSTHEQVGLRAGAELGVNDTSSLKPQPIVVNKAAMPLVVYLERGVLFNKVVIKPGEAAYLWTPKNGPDYLPYGIQALVGDTVPSQFDSLLHFAGKAAVPTAFTAGVIVSVLSAGALTGPAAALAPLVSELPAIAGFTIGATDIAAGSVAAAATKKAAKEFVTEHPKSFMVESGWVLPGTKYFEVVGGVNGAVLADLAINEISPGQFLTYGIKQEDIKLCTALTTAGYMNGAAFTIENCGDARLNGPWRQIGRHHDRPQYSLANGNEGFVIEFSEKHQAWRVTTTQGLFSGRPSLYESKENTGTIPTTGWQAVTAGSPAPTITISQLENQIVV